MERDSDTALDWPSDIRIGCRIGWTEQLTQMSARWFILFYAGIYVRQLCDAIAVNSAVAVAVLAAYKAVVVDIWAVARAMPVDLLIHP